MNVRDLIHELEQYGGDVEIRVAFQPSWPLRASVANVVDGDDLGDIEEDRHILWIAVDQVSSYDENPYAPREAWSA